MTIRPIVRDENSKYQQFPSSESNVLFKIAKLFTDVT